MNKYQELISVIMGVYNGERFLKESIDSILRQSFKEFEFIVVNDASTDRTGKMLDEYAANDPRLKIISNERNMGLTKSLNKGISLAKGKYIARQDADDISLPKRLTLQVQYLEENPDVGFVGCSYILMNECDFQLKVIRVKNSPEFLKSNFFKTNVFAHGSTVFRKDLFDQVGGYREEFKYAQDYDLWLRMSERSSSGWIEHSPLYRQRIHIGSLGRKKRKLQKHFSDVAVKAALMRKKGNEDIELIRDLNDYKTDSRKQTVFCSPEIEMLLLENRILLTNANGSHIRKNLAEGKKIYNDKRISFFLIFLALFLFSYVPKRLRQQISKIVGTKLS